MNRVSYNKVAPQWDAARSSFSGRERHYLETFLSGLEAPASVLDLGCGTGRPVAEYVLACGHSVVGIDQSEEMLALARARFPEAEWIHARIEDYPLAGRYDGVILWDSLFHVERAHHARLLGDLYDCLTPGGRLMCTVGGSAHPAFTDTMFGEEFFYDSHPPEEVASILRTIGFELLIGEFMNRPDGGRDKGRYAFGAQRPG